MQKVLVPVDGSPNAMHALRHLVAQSRSHHPIELHLLNVQPGFSRHVGRFLSRDVRSSWHRDRSDAALADARRLLLDAGIPHSAHACVGERAAEICRMAGLLGVHRIVMGTTRKNALTRMLDGSTTNRVLENTPVPVEVVAGEVGSRWQRWGLPAGVLGFGGLALLSMD